jgi:phosphoadenosine phosphosulfate reductase
VAVLRWACERFGKRLLVTSSFQSQSLALLHMVSQICPDVHVGFLDTGFHFPETLQFRDEVAQKFGLTVRNILPGPEAEEENRRNGAPLHETDPHRCCFLRKIKPMDSMWDQFDAWVTGIRRDQTMARQAMPVLVEAPGGPLRIHPMLRWSRADVRSYIEEHNLPRHPLEAKGYKSIGCYPCTSPVLDSQSEREGRWAGLDKTECGLHSDVFPV